MILKRMSRHGRDFLGSKAKKQMFILESDHPRESCGLVAIHSPEPSQKFKPALLAASGVQHRGQQGAGSVSLGAQGEIIFHRGDGLLTQVFTPDIVDSLNKPSLWTLIHTRYGTSGNYERDNLQPCVVKTSDGETVCVIHNGQFSNLRQMRDSLHPEVFSEGASDTFIFTQMLARAQGQNWDYKVANTLAQVEGAYSLVIGIKDRLYLARDKQGIRPLVVGKKDDHWVVVSETHALDKIGAVPCLIPNHGSLIKIDKFGLTTINEGAFSARDNLCAFEWAYFSHPSSRGPIDPAENNCYDQEASMSFYYFRQRCGQRLAEQISIPGASFVVGVPDSGVALAAGYAKQAKLPYEPATIRDHYDPSGLQRLFMGDDDMETIGSRVLGKLSFAGDPPIWKKAVVIIGDDSIIRGNVSKKLTTMIFDLGASEVHWVIGFPPVRFPCHLGVSMRTHSELIAFQHNGDSEAIAKAIGATSVNYITPENFLSARLGPGRVEIPPDPKDIFLVNGGCGGCITGKYPVEKR